MISHNGKLKMNSSDSIASGQIEVDPLTNIEAGLNTIFYKGIGCYC